MLNLISLFRLKLICWLPLLLISVCVSFSKDKRLSEYGYSDDRNGALSLLRLLNQKQDPKLLSEYLSELDSNDFSNRERATRNLSRLPVIDRLFLKESLKNSTPEVGFRIRSILKQNNKERFDGMIRAMSYEIIRGKHGGLLSDLFSSVEDREQYSMSGMWRSFAEASEVTANEEDVELLKRKLISENDMIRYSSVKTLLSILGEESVPFIATNITDQNPHIKWECANAFMKFQKKECLMPFAELLMCDEDFGLRWRSLESLRKITGQEFGYYAAGNAEERAVPATKWSEWLQKNAASTQFDFGNLVNDDAIVLFSGNDLNEWEFRNLGGGLVAGGLDKPNEETWDIENQTLIAKKGFRGEIITKRSFLNYELSLEYKLLELTSDSGIGIFAADPEKGYLEIQLYNQTSGDLYNIGAAQVVTDDGNPLRFRSSKFKGTNEIMAEWNKMEIRLSDGQSEIKVNGEVQNRALCKDVKPSKIVLRNEGTGAVEFRNLLLKKL
jgi:hypothetical protein